MPLIVVSLVAITGFQAYWLWGNYVSSRQTLQTRANLYFTQSVYAMQARQFQKQFNLPDSNMNVRMSKGGQRMDVVLFNNTGEELSGMMNMMRETKEAPDVHLHARVDSLLGKDGKSITKIVLDSVQVKTVTVTRGGTKADRFLQVLSGIDSLKDSIPVNELKKETANRFMREGLAVPFDIMALDTPSRKGLDPGSDIVTVGISRPVSFKLTLGNTMPYLLGKMLLPILFSMFLVAITLASFVLMYRSLRQQQRLAVLKNDFISNVTHELKTPIATVNVALEALKNFNALNDPQRSREYLDISQQELQRLSLLVDKVLRVSMFENKTVELKPELFNMVALVDEVVSGMRLQFEKLKAEVSVHTEGSDFDIEADRLHILSVVYNLFDNAIKYSVDKPVVISILLKELENVVEVRFSDQGIGIPGEYLGRVFDKFFRVPHGDVHNVKGYGLGLSYVAHIVREHRGEIRVESAEGKGTTFIIKLPKRYA